MRKINFLLGTVLLVVAIFSFSGAQASALKVGYSESAPFVYAKNDSLRGVNYMLWKEVAKNEGFNCEYVKFENEAALELALQSDSVQVGINPYLITSELLTKHPVSVATFVNTTGVITKTNFKHRSWFKAMLDIVSFDFIRVSVLVGVVIFLFGFLMWMAERSKNSEHFHNSRKGLVDSFWWSAVTMTTVGYGDKYPVTFSGKLIALVWMFMAMIIISSLTAGITMILTVSNLSSGITKVEDLSSLYVGTVEGSSSDHFISSKIAPVKFKTLEEAIVQLEEEELDAVVFDKSKLVYYINAHMGQKELEVLPIELNKEMMSFAFSPNFEQVKQVNVKLAEMIKSPYYHWTLANEGLLK